MLYPLPISQSQPLLTRAIAEVQRKSPEPWGEDDILQSLEAGDAFLFSNRQRSGVCILEPIADGYPTVHIWLAYSCETGISALREYEPDIIRLAQAIGAKRLTFTTQRKGYRRALSHWQRNQNCYQRMI